MKLPNPDLFGVKERANPSEKVNEDDYHSLMEWT